MKKRIQAFVIAILVILPILAVAATQNVRATSNPTITVIDSAAILQNHMFFYVKPGQTINLTIYVTGVTSLWSWKVNVTWDSSVLQLAPTGNVTEGPFLSNNGAQSTMFVETPPTAGNIAELSSTLLENTSVSGSGALAYIAFTPQTLGVNTTITIGDVRLVDPTGTDMYPTGLNVISKTISIRLMGDINGDNVVNMKDIALVARAFGASQTSPNWREACDLNYDGVINMKDIALTARQFGQHYP